MEIEIKLKCSICESLLNGGQRLETSDTLIFVQPCPTCHPAKAEKVTPEKDTLVEYRESEWRNGVVNTRYATGTREKSFGLIGLKTTDGMTFFVRQWRYQGETKWRG